MDDIVLEVDDIDAEVDDIDAEVDDIDAELLGLDDINAELLELRKIMDELDLAVLESQPKKDAIEELARTAEDKTNEILENAGHGISMDDAMEYLAKLIELYKHDVGDVNKQAEVTLKDKNKKLSPAQQGAMAKVQAIKQDMFDKLTNKQKVMETIAKGPDPSIFIDSQESKITEAEQNAEENIRKIKDLERAKKENQRNIKKIKSLITEIADLKSKIDELEEIIDKGKYGTLDESEYMELRAELEEINDGTRTFPNEAAKDNRKTEIIKKLRSADFLRNEKNAKDYEKAKKSIKKLKSKRQNKVNAVWDVAKKIGDSIKEGGYSEEFKRDFAVKTHDSDGDVDPWQISSFFKNQVKTYKKEFNNEVKKIEKASTMIAQIEFAANEFGMQSQGTQNRGTQSQGTQNRGAQSQGRQNQGMQTTTKKGEETEIDVAQALRLKAMPENELRKAAYVKALEDRGAKHKSGVLHPILKLRARFGKQLVEDYKNSFVAKKKVTLTAEQKDEARTAYVAGENQFKQTLWVGVKGQTKTEPVITNEMKLKANRAANTEIENELG